MNSRRGWGLGFSTCLVIEPATKQPTAHSTGTYTLSEGDLKISKCETLTCAYIITTDVSHIYRQKGQTLKGKLPQRVALELTQNEVK